MRPSLSLSKPSLWPKIGWVLVGILLLVSFLIDLDHTTRSGAIDLRNRITGARLLEHHIDPYFYKWQEPEPAIYCDPYNNPLLPVSKTTATPAFLLLHLPLAALPYRTAEFLWLVLQWLLFVGTALLWLLRCTSDRQRAWLAIFVVGLTYTAAWRLHAERGQSYVLLLFLLGGWLMATWNTKIGNSFWTGLLGGLLIAFRPPFLLLAPFMVLHRRGQLVGAAVGLLLGMGLPMLWNAGCWIHYGSAVGVHSALYRSGIDPAPPPERFPPTIEGTPTDLVGAYLPIPYADFSLHALLRSIGLEPFPALPPLLVVVAAYGVWLGWSRGLAMERLLLGVAAWFFLVDLCLPAYRNTYNDVMVLNIVALGLITFRDMPWGVWVCLAALPVGWAVETFQPMDNVMVDAPTFFLTLGVGLLLCWATPAAARRRS